MAARPTARAARVPIRNGPPRPSGEGSRSRLQSLVDHRAEDDRNEEQEREARCRVAVELIKRPAVIVIPDRDTRE